MECIVCYLKSKVGERIKAGRFIVNGMSLCEEHARKECGRK